MNWVYNLLHFILHIKYYIIVYNSLYKDVILLSRVGKSFEKSLPLARKAFFVCGKLIGCPAGAPYLGQKKIVPVEKKFLHPPPPIQKYVL